MTSLHMKLFALFMLFCLQKVEAHGRLVTPTTRVGHSNYENSPVTGQDSLDFVCRHEDALPPSVTWNAGENVALGFNFGVNHVGFCQGFLSYDYDKPREDMKWFKVANFIDCADDFVSTADMELPNWLPTGQAVFRWSWVALHLWPSAEFYCQCADIMIQGNQNAVAIADIPTYSVKGMLPANGNEGVGYANPYGSGVTDRATGPACALGFDKNDCPLTLPGTAGYIATGSDTQTTQPVSTSTDASSTSVETTVSTTESSSTASTTVDPNCAGTWVSTQSNVSDDWCVSNCAVDPTWCSSYCQCDSDGSAAPSTKPTEALPTSSTLKPSLKPTQFGETTTTSVDSGDAVNLCYFTNWARYRTGFMNVGKDAFEMGLDAHLCTHINYGFGTIDPVSLELKSFDPNADHPNGAESQTTLCADVCKPGYVHDWNTGANPCEWPCNPDRELRGFEGVNVGLKRQNPSLKSILSVGGWNFNDCAFTGQSGQGRDSCEIFSNIASTEALSRQHALKVIEFLRNWGFDGYDIDWEYPVVAGHNNLNMQATPQDYANYIRMLRIIREEFVNEAQTSGRTQLLLTAAVGVGKSTVERAYDIAAMSEQLDLIGLMTYDLHGTWEPVTGFNAPLYATSADEAHYSYPVSVSWAVDYWLQHGARADQLLMGIATYGRGWKLANSESCSDALCPTNGAAAAGASTKLAGYLAYYEIEDLISSGNAVKHFDNDRKVPYVVTSSGDWIGFDDVESLQAKLDFLKSRNLRGAMTWAIDLDVLTSYPLLNTLRDGLNTEVESASTTSNPTPTAVSTTSIPSSTTVSSTAIPSSTTDSPSFSPTSSVSTAAPTNAGSTASPSPATTTEDNRTCVSRKYVSIDVRATDVWCQANCAHDEAWCYSTKMCACEDGSVPVVANLVGADVDAQSGSLVVSSILVLVLTFLCL